MLLYYRAKLISKAYTKVYIKKIINKLIIFRAKFAYAYNMCARTHKNEIVPISFRI